MAPPQATPAASLATRSARAEEAPVGALPTGKEEDIEVGLAYFGKRYLNPLLGRWVSPDPLAVHVPGEADWSLYAYVRAGLLKNVDPLGLQERGGAGGAGGTGRSGGFRGGGGVNNSVDNSVDPPDAAPTSSWTAPIPLPKFSSAQAERNRGNGIGGAPPQGAGGGTRGTSGTGRALPTPSQSGVLVHRF
jgi:RHS repeat-associated protein